MSTDDKELMATRLTPGTPEVAAAFHAYWKKRIGYCHHETGYKRCEADATWVTTALAMADLAIGPDATCGRSTSGSEANDD